MTSNLDITEVRDNKDAVLVITGSLNGDSGWVDQLRSRYPEWTVTQCRTFLSGIAEAARKPFRAILAGVDSSLPKLERAVAGLREAAGPETRLLLCCTPELEPLARNAMAGGADDYLLHPLDLDELDTAVGYGRPSRWAPATLTPAPAASAEELVLLAEVLVDLDTRPRVLIQKLAGLIRTALTARGATIIVEGSVATDGEVSSKPVLTAALHGSEGVVGQLTIGRRAEGAYTPADVEKLKHYATLAGHILQAASKQRHWRRLAATDECSGLPNRRYLHERLDDILAQAGAGHFPVTLLLFDLDDFKTYNDRFGHDAGDEIIRVAGQLFRKHCREQDVVARYGGDEFAVVFWDADGPRVAGSKHPDGALGVLDRVREALRSHEFTTLGPSTDARLTISGGLATYPWDATTRPDLLKRADEALLSAKRAGKNRIYLIGRGASGDAP